MYPHTLAKDFFGPLISGLGYENRESDFHNLRLKLGPKKSLCGLLAITQPLICPSQCYALNGRWSSDQYGA